MERIDIQNVGRMPRCFNLPHQEVCVKAGRCLCDAKTGACSSLHILAQQRARDVDAAVLLSSEVRDAVESNSLIVFASKRDFAPADVVQQGNETSAGSRKSAHTKGKKSKE